MDLVHARGRSVGAGRRRGACVARYDRRLRVLWTIGAEMRQCVTSAMEASGVEGVTIDGLDPMWMMRWDSPDRERRFLELAAAHGVLFKRGAYNYAALAHDEDAMREIERGASGAFVELRDEEAQ